MIRVYTFDIRNVPVSDPVDWERSHILSRIQDKTRILKYINREDRCRSACGELVVLGHLGEGVIVRIDSTGRHVKPHFQDIPSPFFNISHDADFVTVATSKHFSVGIDIMKVQLSGSAKNAGEMLENLRSIFTKKEWAYIVGPGSNEQEIIKRFYHIWTGKEAFLKCIGTGLYTEPHVVEVHVNEVLGGAGVLTTTISLHDTSCIPNPRDANSFICRIFTEAIPGYIVSVCWGPPELCDPSWAPRSVPASPISTPIDVEFINLDSL
jgi:4'-phosphopantetheinyl transferase